MKQAVFLTILILASCFTAFSQKNENLCPTVSVKNTIPIEPYPVIFTAEISGADEKSDVEYLWKVKDGKIIEGQETKRLKVLYYEKYDEINTVATLEIKGFPRNCENVVSKNFRIKIHRSKPIKYWHAVFFDEYQKLALVDEKTRFSVFLKKLKEDRTAEGFVLLEISTKAELNKRLRRFRNYLSTERFNKNRISFAVVKGEKGKTQLWAVPQDEKLPSCKDCLIVKAERQRQNFGKLFTTKKYNRKR
jgi:hypothetical protein